MNLRRPQTLRFTDRVVSTPDERARAGKRDELRHEARCFAERQRARLQHLFDLGRAAVGSVEKWCWQTVGLPTRGGLPSTGLSHQEVTS